MRTTLYAAAAAAVAVLVAPATLESALATAASVLCEATPFLLAGVLVARLLPRCTFAGAYLGCGCGDAPAARSLPAAAATALAFGPWIALARFAAAVVAAAGARVRRRRCPDAAHERTDVLAELHRILPSAVAAGIVSHIVASVHVAGAAPLEHIAFGAAFAFFSAPCALGAVAIAGALHAKAPLAAWGYLCVAGIFDLRWFRTSHGSGRNGDALGCAVLACGLTIVALRHGDALVHPALSPFLLLCAIAELRSAAVRRTQVNAALRWAPSLVLAASLIAAPPPNYRATETTIGDLFAGERLTFTGRVSQDGGQTALVRYAITCCRADAAPVVIRLSRPLDEANGTWLRADGIVENVSGEPRMVPQHVERIAPPTDPFVYR